MNVCFMDGGVDLSRASTTKQGLTPELWEPGWGDPDPGNIHSGHAPRNSRYSRVGTPDKFGHHSPKNMFFISEFLSEIYTQGETMCLYYACATDKPTSDSLKGRSIRNRTWCALTNNKNCFNSWLSHSKLSAKISAGQTVINLNVYVASRPLFSVFF